MLNFLKYPLPLSHTIEYSKMLRDCFRRRIILYGYQTHWFRHRVRLYNQNEAYNSVAVYGYGTNSPWNGLVAVQNRPLAMYECSQSFICAS